jgi:hypothetical protein
LAIHDLRKPEKLIRDYTWARDNYLLAVADRRRISGTRTSWFGACRRREVRTVIQLMDDDRLGDDTGETDELAAEPQDIAEHDIPGMNWFQSPMLSRGDMLASVEQCQDLDGRGITSSGTRWSGARGRIYSSIMSDGYLEYLTPRSKY